jgi:uncharacterized protein YbjT (DUF2867 family)
MENILRTFLITGATGDIGSRVVELLLERGDRPRVFVRDAGKARARYGDRVDIVIGDLADEASLMPALEGVDALFLVNSGPDLAHRDEAAAKAAKARGVKHLVKLSSMDAQQGVGTGPWHAQGEAAIRASGITFTFVEPAGFMSNALGWAMTIKNEGVVRACTGDGRVAFVHLDDIAAVATKALTTREYEGESLPITGPESLSYAEMTAKISAVIGKPLTFQPVSEEHLRQRLMTSGEPSALIEAHISLWRAIHEGRLATVTDKVQRIIGRRPITFDQWARQNAEVFR